MTLLPSTEAQTSGTTDGSAGSSLRIFINYRAADTGWAAWALYFKLEARFGAGNLFFDKGTLRGGMQWLEEIKSGLAGAGVLIALIGPSWMSKLVAHLQSGAQDYVVKEIDIALRNSKCITVVPVLVDDAAQPLAAELPPALRSLPGRQAERLRQGRADDDIQHLVELLNRPRDRGPGDNTMTELTTGAIAPPPPAEHFQTVAMRADDLVVFLGSGANSDEAAEPWQEGCGRLPDDRDLARYIAARAELRIHLPNWRRWHSAPGLCTAKPPCSSGSLMASRCATTPPRARCTSSLLASPATSGAWAWSLATR